MFFIASGHCSVVRRIELVKRMISKQKYKYVLPPLNVAKNNVFQRTDADSKVNLKQNQAFRLTGDKKEFIRSLDIQRQGKTCKKKKSSTKGDVIETRYFTISELSDGDYFNVGESMDGLYVISIGRVRN